MNEFHPNEVNNQVPMDGEITGYVKRRAAIKLSGEPHLMVAMPIGPKKGDMILECPTCKENGGNFQYKVTQGFNPYGLVPIVFMLQHMNWVPPLNILMGYIYKTGMLSAAARQIMTQETKRLGSVKYIFYLDDDMIIPPNGLSTLYNFMERHPEAGAVSGIYTTRVDPPEPLIYTEHGKGSAWDIELGPEANPTPIIGAGAGCLLARIEAIKDWEQANPDTPIWCDSTEYPTSQGNKITWGHDVRFIRNLTEAGWPCYADGRVLCGHYDCDSGKIYNVPEDSPGFKKRNINTETYWDQVYTREGFDSWRDYQEMFDHIVSIAEVNEADQILELGCGPGVLGQRLTARFPCNYTGFDLSPVAVNQAKARYLDAKCKDVRDLVAEDFADFNTVIATELMEHLSPEDSDDLLMKLNDVGKFKSSHAPFLRFIILSTPWECMSPEEVPEHQVLVDQEWLDRAKSLLSNFHLESSVMVDKTHRVHFWKSGS